LKLLLLADAAAPHTRRWANWFAEKGLDVHIVTFNNISDFGYKNVIIHTLWNRKIPSNPILRLGRSLYILIKLKLLVKKLDPDIIHCHSLGSYAWSALLLRLRPRVVTPWGTDLIVDMFNSRINYFLSKKSLRTSELITTDALHFIPVLHKFGIDKNKLLHLTFGTDVTKFHALDSKPHNESVNIVSTRTLNPVHCVDDLINAIPEILKSRPNVSFVIVGGGTQYDDFVSNIFKLGISSKVHFKGMLTENELLGVLQTSDIYVSTSMHDAGLAASTAEAMACELPIVHPDVADNRAWVKASGGLHYEVRNISQLVKSIIYLIDHPSERVQMGQNNRKTIEEYFSLEKNMSTMLRQYELLVEN